MTPGDNIQHLSVTVEKEMTAGDYSQQHAIMLGNSDETHCCLQQMAAASVQLPTEVDGSVNLQKNTGHMEISANCDPLCMPQPEVSCSLRVFLGL